MAALRALVNRERTGSGGTPMSPITQNPPRLPPVTAAPHPQPPTILAQPPTPATSIASANTSIRAQPGTSTPRSPISSSSPATVTGPDQGYFASAQMAAPSPAPAPAATGQQPGGPLPLGPVLGGPPGSNASPQISGQTASQTPTASGPASPSIPVPLSNDTLPPLITHSSHSSSTSAASSGQRARSATQTARMAVADVVRRFNTPGSSSQSTASGAGTPNSSQAQST